MNVDKGSIKEGKKIELVETGQYKLRSYHKPILKENMRCTDVKEPIDIYFEQQLH